MRGPLLILLLLFTARAFAAEITLAWDAVTSPLLTGYMVYSGPSAGVYLSRIDVGNVTSYTVSGLTEGATYHFAVTAYDSSHVESGYSNDAAGTVAYSVPAANFSVSTTSGTAPLALNFSNTSTGTITSYGWMFGDGGTSAAQNPAYLYAAADVYTVSLTVTGPGGSNTKTITNYITVSSAPPAATMTTLSSSANPSTSGSSVSFTATVTGNAPTGNITFVDSGSSIGGCASVALSGSGNTPTASCSTAGLAAGPHTIVAKYSGDSANAPSTSPTLTQVVNSSGAPANLGFETPDLGGGYHAPSGATWQFVQAGITGNANLFTNGNPPAPEGAQVAFLQGRGSSATQTASVASGTYMLSFQAAQRGNWQHGTQVILVLVDGAAVGQFQPPGTFYSQYQTGPFIIATSGSHTLTLQGIGDGDSDFTAFVDDIQLTPVGSGGLLANIGFETPDLGGGYHAPSGATWQFVQAGITGNANLFTNGNPPAPEGAQVAFLQGRGSSATQTASVASGTYMLSFQAAQRGNWQHGTQVILVLVDGAAVGQFQPPGTFYSQYQTGPFIIATSGSHTLTLQGIGDGDSDFTAFVDDIQLTPVGSGGLLANIGFEAPALGGGYQYAPAGATWTFSGGAGVTGNWNAFTSGNPPAPDGMQVAFVQGYGSSISQTAIIVAGTYVITVQGAQRANWQYGMQVIQILVDGVEVGQFQPPDASYTTYQTPPFALTNGNHTLMLQGIGGGGSDFTAFVDNVQLQAANVILLVNSDFETLNLAGDY